VLDYLLLPDEELPEDELLPEEDEPPLYDPDEEDLLLLPELYDPPLYDDDPLPDEPYDLEEYDPPSELLRDDDDGTE